MEKYDKFMNNIDNYASETKISGYLYCCYENKTFERKYNLEETLFPVSLLSFCESVTRKLIAEGKISSSDKVNDYLNIPFALDKTIDDILNNKSNFPNYENIAIKIVNKKCNFNDYSLQDQRYILETQAINKNISLDDLNECYSPDKRNNKTNMLVLKYIIEKVLNKSLYEACLEYVLNIKHQLVDNITLYGRYNVGKNISIPFSDLIASDYIFVDVKDLTTIAEIKDISLITLSVCDFTYYKSSDLCYVIALLNRGGAINVGGHNHGFTYFFVKEVKAINLYPTHPKFIRVNKKNYCDIMEFETEAEQEGFVCDPRNSLCYSFYSKYRQAYALVDEDVVIGLAVLDFDKRNEIYDINILQIDKRYQNRGYGRILLEKSLEKIKKISNSKGYITIGVKRDNLVAYKLYKSFGFIEKTINPGFIILEKIM